MTWVRFDMWITRNKIKIRLSVLPVEDCINKWFSERNIFFVLGSGRSGTKFFSELFNSDENAIVFHEPIPEDFDAFCIAHKDEKSAFKYMSRYRMKKIYSLVKDLNVKTYGEVNSALRYHVGAIPKCFPHSKTLHLIRDGRDVVRSFISRNHYTKGSKGHHALRPDKEDPWYYKWDKLNRFERICWLWADANRRVRKHVNRYVKFEKAISDYNYFQRNIENYLGLDIGREKWIKAINRPKNTTKQFVLPHWKKWDERLTESFEKICGEEMRIFRYE
jgi:hypothetical protein